MKLVLMYRIFDILVELKKDGKLYGKQCPGLNEAYSE